MNMFKLIIEVYRKRLFTFNFENLIIYNKVRRKSDLFSL